MSIQVNPMDYLEQSNIAATINLVLGIICLGLGYLVPNTTWYYLLLDFVSFVAGMTIIYIAKIEYRKAAAANRAMKMGFKMK